MGLFVHPSTAEGKGVEPTTNPSEKQGSPDQDSVKSSFVTDGSQLNDADRTSLQIVVIAWSYLTQKDRQEILAVVRRAVTHADYTEKNQAE